MGIKNVGEAAIEKVLNERDANGPYKDIKDFFTRCGSELNSRMIESLIMSGALDSFGKNRATLMGSYKSILEAVNKEKKNQGHVFIHFRSFSNFLMKRSLILLARSNLLISTLLSILASSGNL